MTDVKTKYKISNNRYRLIKAITEIKVDIKLLERATKLTSIEAKSISMPSPRWDNLEKEIADREQSLKKKREKLKELLAEYKKLIKVEKEMQDGYSRV